MNKLKIGVDVGENEAEPREFLECGLLAEAEGFDSFWFGDHFMPWIHTGGRSVFIWSLLAPTLERTHRVTIGPDVTCPIGGRFHPAIVAQAAATLDNMYPGRFMLGVGSGEAVNEAPFFESQDIAWPRWKQRIERLAEAIALMRQLWASEDYFTFKGKFFKMSNVRFYTKSKTKIPIYFSAIGPKAAGYAGRLGDHLITITSPQACKEVVFPKFEEGALSIGKDPRKAEKMVLVNMMIGDPDASVRKLKKGWAGLLADGAYDQPDPRRVEEMASTVNEELIRQYFQLCPTVDDLVEAVESYRKAGANHVVLETGPSQQLIKAIAKRVLPRVRSRE
jgi:coenzyme F420-dependent glucose-6-phosphate dehydrogenase